jgi:hypothetical protein
MPACWAWRCTVSSSQLSTWLRGWVMTWALVALETLGGQEALEADELEGRGQQEEHGQVGEHEQDDSTREATGHGHLHRGGTSSRRGP